jgi:hypothetical protein
VDGSDLLEIVLDDIVERYVAFVEDYYETEADRSAVEHIVAGLPLTDDVVRALNPATTLADVRADCVAIGYPIATQ